MRSPKYTKEMIECAVKDSVSVAQVLRKLGLKEAGGSHTNISRKIKSFGIDTSHFLGQGANCGENHKGSCKRKPEDILIKRSVGRREHSFRLRRALIETGREYKCELCELGNVWNNKEIRLQVDHINRDWLDDQANNLRFLCPNCHSQTEGYNGSKGLSGLTKCKWYSK
jgi:hypothetical protein